MGRSCSLTTIQAASSCRISSSCPTHWTAQLVRMGQVQRDAFDLDGHILIFV